VFFARVPPNVPYEELHGVFSKYGTVTNLNLYRRWATAKTSKGCGLVEYTTQEEAQAAMDALNGNYRFDSYPGSEAPMVVEWMDASRLTPPAGKCHTSTCTQ
jgi:RNA recognition motif-containing protein